MAKHIRQIRVEGNIALVTLTQGYIATIDAADVHLVDGLNWCAMAQDHAVYAKRTDYCGGKPRSVLLHRVLMGNPEGLEVDHIDGDGLNNRRSNLRVATHPQNMRNQRISKRNTSGVKGVDFHKQSGLWRARITVNGATTQRYFRTKAAACDAYAKASAELHGQFRRME